MAHLRRFSYNDDKPGCGSGGRRYIRISRTIPMIVTNLLTVKNFGGFSFVGELGKSLRKFAVFLLVLFLPSLARAVCTPNQIEINNTCIDSKFSIKTVPDTSLFRFVMSAIGTFYIDWGDGTVDTIIRNDTNMTTYYHNYSVVGAYTIKFGGVATAYASGWENPVINFFRDNGSVDKIASVHGSLGALFPQYGTTDGTFPVFHTTFANAINLKSIPSTLFSGLTGGGEYMFDCTFKKCFGLINIPSDLFESVTDGAKALFEGTFEYCTSLTSIPSGLFRNITSSGINMFNQTFGKCTNLSGFIPPDTFSGLIANQNNLNMYTWERLPFNQTNLDTICPDGSTQYTTGFESYWDGHVSCQCNSGKILYAGACHTPCPVGLGIMHFGAYSYQLFADRINIPSPVLGVQYSDGTVCYLYFEPDTGGEHGFKTLHNNTVYHAINPL